MITVRTRELAVEKQDKQVKHQALKQPNMKQHGITFYRKSMAHACTKYLPLVGKILPNCPKAHLHPVQF